MIYDCITYSGFGIEEDLLMIRAKQLQRLNVTHVIVESRHTFTGKRKGLYFYAEKFPFPHKYQSTSFVENTSPWDNEQDQRNQIKYALAELKPNDDDIVILSDVDEIPNAIAIEKYRTNYGICALQMDEYHMRFDLRSGYQTWRHPKILPWGVLLGTSPNATRNGGFNLILPDAGWHFSWMGTDEDILQKFASFSHQERAVQQFANYAHVNECRVHRKHLITGQSLERVELMNLPIYIQDNKEYFKDHLYVS